MAILINKLKPFIAIVIMVFVIIGIVNFARYVKLQPQIKENCGWEKGSVKCFCEKNDYYEHKAYYENLSLNKNLNPLIPDGS